MTRVLVVDDDPTILNALEIVLKREGYDTVTAATAEDALKLARASEFGVIVLDILLPGMSGLDFLKAYDMTERGSTKVIALSNVDAPDTMAAAQKLGALTYLVKAQYTPHEVVDLVKGVTTSKPA